MTQSDRDLISRIQERDGKAFELLYARHKARVLRYLHSIVRDAHAADDLMQEVFLRLWTRAEQWKGSGPLNAWLLRIATNLALNHMRSVRRRRQRPLQIQLANAEDDEENLMPGWMIDTAALGPDVILEHAEASQRLLHLVNDLSEKHRQVLRLVHEAEMDTSAVAEALGIPEGTVKSRLHFARKHLARRWKEIGRREK